jgi:hypothetical protein
LLNVGAVFFYPESAIEPKQAIRVIMAIALFFEQMFCCFEGAKAPTQKRVSYLHGAN